MNNLIKAAALAVLFGTAAFCGAAETITQKPDLNKIEQKITGKRARTGGHRRKRPVSGLSAHRTARQSRRARGRTPDVLQKDRRSALSGESEVLRTICLTVQKLRENDVRKRNESVEFAQSRCGKRLGSGAILRCALVLRRRNLRPRPR